MTGPRLVPAVLWTAEADAVLAKLVRSGASSGQIAKAMDKTRNSIIGRIFRIGLKLRGKAFSPSQKGVRKGGRLLDAAREMRSIARGEATPAFISMPLPEPPTPPAPMPTTVRRMHDLDLMRMFAEQGFGPIVDILHPAAGLAGELGIRVYTKDMTPPSGPGMSGEHRAVLISLPYVSILGKAA